MPGSSAGKVPSGCAGCGAAWINPGNRNDAGETPWVAFIPLHPATNRSKTEIMASRKTFQFNLTESQYSLSYGFSNT